MTREELKRRLLNIERRTPIHTREDARDFEALEMAIKALEQPKYFINGSGEVIVLDEFKDIPIMAYSQGKQDALSQEPCDDAISRDAAINIASLHCLTIDETVKALEQLPSVTQKSAKDYLDMADRKAKKIKDALTDNPHKSGKWIAQQEANGDDYFKAYDISGDMTYAAKYKCDKCGFIQICIEDHGQYKYCPNCGARMESEDKE